MLDKCGLYSFVVDCHDSLRESRNDKVDNAINSHNSPFVILSDSEKSLKDTSASLQYDKIKSHAFRPLLSSLPTPPSNGWESVKLTSKLTPFKTNGIKIPKNEFLERGKYPIVSQEADNFINGYTNLENPISENLPIVLFGDHTCVFKFIDFAFFRGADGTQILKFDNSVNTKFAYYCLQNIEIENKEKYQRHFKYLQEVKIPLPPLNSQEKVINAVENVERQIKILQDLSAGIESKKSEIIEVYLNN